MASSIGGEPGMGNVLRLERGKEGVTGYVRDRDGEVTTGSGHVEMLVSWRRGVSGMWGQEPVWSALRRELWGHRGLCTPPTPGIYNRICSHKKRMRFHICNSIDGLGGHRALVK